MYAVLVASFAAMKNELHNIVTFLLYMHPKAIEKNGMDVAGILTTEWE